MFSFIHSFIASQSSLMVCFQHKQFLKCAVTEPISLRDSNETKAAERSFNCFRRRVFSRLGYLTAMWFYAICSNLS